MNDLPPIAQLDAALRCARDSQRLIQLEHQAQASLHELPWSEPAAELGVDPAAIGAALAQQAAWAATGPQLLAPFVGHWFGGDIHDVQRAFAHVWGPTQTHAGLAVQPVTMFDVAAGRAVSAWNWVDGAASPPQLAGVVGDRLHRGYALPAGALLWIGEERDGQLSFHLERVSAGGQLYDVRGFVVHAGDAGRSLVVRCASDWRYHRVAAHALSGVAAPGATL